MSPVEKTYKIDVGRLIVVPIFAFLLTLSFLILWRDLRALFPINIVKSLLLIHRVLSVCFYTLVIFLYFIRSSASSTSRSHVINFIAICSILRSIFYITILGQTTISDTRCASCGQFSNNIWNSPFDLFGLFARQKL